MITLPSGTFRLIYVGVGVLVVLGIMLWVSNPSTTVGIGGVMIFTAIMLMVFVVPLNVYTNELRELEQKFPPPPPLEETRKVPTKSTKRATPLPPPNQKEIAKLVKTIEKPPPPNWAKATVTFMIGLGKLWGELKLLIVGAISFYFGILEFDWNWNVDASFYIILRIILIAMGMVSIATWIQNSSRWEPKPLGGGRWVALVFVSIVVCSAIIIVFAIIHMTQLIQLMRFLGIKGV